MDRIIEFLSSKGLMPETIVAVISMLPVFELRGGIPVGILAFKMGMLHTAVYSILGNLIPLPFILEFFKPVSEFFERTNRGNNFIAYLRRRAASRSKIVEKWGYIGLMLFVAIPLPGSGLWTGSLIAFFLNMSPKKAFVYIVFGVLIAAIAVLLLTYLIKIGIIQNTGIFVKKVGV